jgi:uncharacterized membrane protein YphA (DoxX/SURF4 family)
MEAVATHAIPAAASVRRVLHRWVAAYLGVYLFPFPLSWFDFVPGAQRIHAAVENAWTPVLRFAGTRLFHLEGDLSPVASGSGDRLRDYVQVFCMAVFAALLATAWSALATEKRDQRILAWTRLAARGFLGSMIISYGVLKLLPLQMPPPNFARLIEPYGRSSPMGLAWTFIGASPAYGFFAGAGETLGGLLLFFGRTTLAGALLLLGVLANVVALNFCYDVPVKLFSSTLLAMALFIAAPHLPRIAALLSGKAIAAPPPQDLFARPWAKRSALAVQVLLLAGVLYDTVPRSWKAYRLAQDPPRAEAGLYRVEGAPWALAAIDFYGPSMSLSALDADGVFHRWVVTPGPAADKWKFAGRRIATEPFELAHTAPDADHVVLDGTYQGKAIHALLTRQKEPHFLLQDRGFHWVNDFPYNY